MVKFALKGEDFEGIQREYGIPKDIALEVPHLSGRVTSPQKDRVALYEEAFKAGLRLPVLSVLAKLLRWYQLLDVCPRKKYGRHIIIYSRIYIYT